MKLPGLKEKVAILNESESQNLPLIYVIKDDQERFQFMTEIAAIHTGAQSSAELMNRTFRDFNCEAADFAQEFTYYENLCKEQRSETLLLSLIPSAAGAQISLICNKPIINEKGKVEGVETWAQILPSDACIDKIVEGYQYLSSTQSQSLESTSHKGVLTVREQECVYYLTRGLTFIEIAKKMHISPRTVESHVINIKAKLHVKTRSELIVKACELGYLEIKLLDPAVKPEKLQLLNVKPCEEIEDRV